MTATTTIPRTAPSTFRPWTATVGAGLLLVVGTVNAIGGTVFSALAGGAWLVATPVFIASLVLWWRAGLGLLRGSRNGYQLGLGMLVALFAFGLMKIFVYHESAAYLFQTLDVVIAALWLSPSSRGWTTRP
jgi:hypothetical protein